jgi:hypothetical protein
MTGRWLDYRNGDSLYRDCAGHWWHFSRYAYGYCMPNRATVLVTREKRKARASIKNALRYRPN